MSSNLIRWGGLAAMLGGLLWIVAAIITASKPRGCIGPAECDVMAMRDTSDVAPLLLLALMLSAVGLAGMVIRAWNTGRLDRLGQVSVALCAVGVMLLVLGMGLNAISEVFWALVPLGGLALVIGLALVGIAALRMEALPRWAAVLLIIGSLGMLGFNDQNAQVLMAIPFGIGWVAVGYALWSGRGATLQRPPRVA
jgi:hypothetical protein